MSSNVYFAKLHEASCLKHVAMGDTYHVYFRNSIKASNRQLDSNIQG